MNGASIPLPQGATVNITRATTMESSMLQAMLIMSLAFWAYCIAVTLMRVRSIILERERNTSWVRDMVVESET